MGFTTPAFIRKNTPELRKKLEGLGYLFIPNGWKEWSIPIENCEYLLCDTDTYQGNPISYYTGKVCKPNLGIDCGANEELFLSIASLRDDTDKYQWFIMDVEIYVYIPKGTWFQSTDRNGGRHVGTQIESLYCHKATVEELIEHFNKS